MAQYEGDNLRPVVLDLLKTYMEQIGPFAKVILKQEMTKMGISSTTMKRAHWPHLCEALAGKIHDYNRRSEFSAQAKRLLDF